MKSTESLAEDVDLHSRIARGDAKAEERLCAKYHEKILFFATRKVGRKEEAEDLCQDTFLVVLKTARKGSIENPEKLSSFIYRTCSNKVNDWLGKKYGIKLEELDDDTIEDLPADIEQGIIEETIDEQRRKKLLRAWRKLSQEDRRILYLLYVRDCSSEKVGGYFGLTAEAVRQRAHRAKEQIKKGFFKKSRKSRSQNP